MCKVSFFSSSFSLSLSLSPLPLLVRLLMYVFFVPAGFVAETATFISECSEDENDVVVKECFKLKEAVESVAGAIDGL